MTQQLAEPSLALYIHWPFCKAKCPYCDFNSHVRDTVKFSAWQAALLAEMAHDAARTKSRQLTSIFFGGGTPSLMPPELVAALIEGAQNHWRFADDIEITLEANPTSVEAGRFKAFRQAGVNRVSLGIQSLRPEVLSFLGRQHSAQEAITAIALAQKHFPRYSFDLIYARPNQAAEDWKPELAEALTLAGDHLSLYQLTIEPNTAFHHARAIGKLIELPDNDATELYEQTQAQMEAHGMPAYEVSNHARVGQESRHNLTYWRYGEYVGIGPGAHGRLPALNGGRIATESLKSPELWLSQVQREGHGRAQETTLSAREMLEEQLMMGLRLNEKLRFPVHASLPDALLSGLQDEGLLYYGNDWLEATARGRMVLTALTGALAAELVIP